MAAHDNAQNLLRDEILNSGKQDSLVLVSNVTGAACSEAQVVFSQQVLGMPDILGRFRRSYLPFFLSDGVVQAFNEVIDDASLNKAFHNFIKQIRAFGRLDETIIKWLAGYWSMSSLDIQQEPDLKRIKRKLDSEVNKVAKRKEWPLPWLTEKKYRALLEESLSAIERLFQMQQKISQRVDELLVGSENLITRTRHKPPPLLIKPQLDQL